MEKDTLNEQITETGTQPENEPENTEESRKDSPRVSRSASTLMYGATILAIAGIVSKILALFSGSLSPT